MPFNATTFAYDVDAGDNSLPVDSADPANLVRATTDFLFDVRAPESFAGTPAVGSAITGLVNLAPDDNVLLARSGQPTTFAAAAGYFPRRDANGLWFDSYSTGANTFQRLNGKRTGLADALVWSPKDEGFKDFLAIIWYRVTALEGSGYGLIGAGSGNTTSLHWGLRISSGGIIAETNAGLQLPAGTGTDAGGLHQLAISYAFNTTADTTAATLFLDRAQVAAGAGRAPSAFVAGATAGGAPGLGGVGAYAGFHGRILRVSREFAKITAPVGGDAAAIVSASAAVAADYDANYAALAALG